MQNHIPHSMATMPLGFGHSARPLGFGARRTGGTSSDAQPHPPSQSLPTSQPLPPSGEAIPLKHNVKRNLTNTACR